MRYGLLLLLVLLLSAAGYQNDDLLQHPRTQDYLSRLKNDFGYQPNKLLLLVSIARQELYLVQNGYIEKAYAISTAAAGVGSESGSGKTPAGLHQVTEKFGAGAPEGTIFVGRQNTGKIAEIIKEPMDIPKDEVTTRILWLSGLEPGVNKGGKVDSHNRYIYIHGTSEEGLIGQPASHGCIRMYNKEVIELFNRVEVGCYVVIVDDVAP